MKRIILSSALVIACAAFMSLLFPSCTAGESDLPAPAEQPQAYSASMQKRTLDEAIAIAQNASATFERKGGTRAAVTKTVSPYGNSKNDNYNTELKYIVVSR